jgi:hypothetical protein
MYFVAKQGLANYLNRQLAESAVTWDLFDTILDRIARLAIPPQVVIGRMPA